MKQLVVYFSRVGENVVHGDLEIIKKGFTEIVAEKIADFTGADLFKLEPEDPYPEDYEECVRRARSEDAANAASFPVIFILSLIENYLPRRRCRACACIVQVYHLEMELPNDACSH